MLAGHQSFQIGVAATLGSCWQDAPEEEQRWTFVGAVDADADADTAVGWLALNRVELLPGGEAASYTLGGAPFTGAVSGATLTTTTEVPFEEGAPPDDLFSIALALSWHRDLSISGTATGVWQVADENHRCDRPFTGVVSGGPDTTPPAAVAWLDDGRPLLPFEAVAGTFTEPVAPDSVSVSASVDGSSQDATLTLVRDATQAAWQFAIATNGFWPSPSTVRVDLDAFSDVAGNAAHAQLGPFAVVKTPDTLENPGFESGLEQWVIDPLPQPNVYGPVYRLASYGDVDLDGTPYTIPPPEGGYMALIDGGARLIGHVAPATPAARFKLYVGVLDPGAVSARADGVGFLLDIATPDGTFRAADGSALPEPANPAATFTGFALVSVELPEAARGGFWFVLQPFGFMPPVHVPTVLVDGIHVNQQGT